MKAAFLTGPREIETREIPEPRLEGARDVLLHIETVGVCGSDLHYFRTGRSGSAAVRDPFIMGHECAGTVQKVGSEVRGLQAGQRVAIDPLVACGHCDQCRAGRRHTCRNQRFLGLPGQMEGALVEYLAMPEECCFPVPAGMTAEQATLVEPLSIGVYAQGLSKMEAGARIAVLGSGPIGLSVLLACRATGDCRVYATDLIPERQKLAAQLGAAWTGNPRHDDVVRAIRDAEPQGVDLVFECAGEQETLQQGVELLKPGGTLIIVGIPEKDQVSFPIHILRRKELTIRNVRRQNHCTEAAIELVAGGKASVDPLMTHRFPLEETQAAFDMVANYRDGVVKALIHVADGA